MSHPESFAASIRANANVFAGRTLFQGTNDMASKKTPGPAPELTTSQAYTEINVAPKLEPERHPAGGDPHVRFLMMGNFRT
jgi:hypothetical protein